MQSYSQDLRKRILDTVERGEESFRQIARRFLVSISFVTDLVQRYRSTGSLQPKPHGGGNPPILGPEDLERLQELIREQPDATLEELRQRLGVSCCLMTIARALDKLGLPRKKKVPPRSGAGQPGSSGETAGIPRADGRYRPAPAGLRGRMRGQHRDDPDSRPCPDGPARLHQYSRPLGVDHAHLRAAPLRSDGGVGLPSATNTAMFENYVEDVLVPELKPGDVVVWDNLRPHQSEEVVEAVERAGCAWCRCRRGVRN